MPPVLMSRSDRIWCYALLRLISTMTKERSSIDQKDNVKPSDHWERDSDGSSKDESFLASSNSDSFSLSDISSSEGSKEEDDSTEEVDTKEVPTKERPDDEKRSVEDPEDTVMKLMKSFEFDDLLKLLGGKIVKK